MFANVEYMFILIIHFLVFNYGQYSMITKVRWKELWVGTTELIGRLCLGLAASQSVVPDRSQSVSERNRVLL